MSVRLETTPWFTKNLAAGRVDTGRLLGALGGAGRMVPQRTAREGCRSCGVSGGVAAPGPARTARPMRIILAMLLALDIGNTNVTLGLFRAGALLATRRAATAPRATADELESLLEALLRLDGLSLADTRCDRGGLGRAGGHRRARARRRAPRPAARRGRRGHGADPDPGGPAGRGRRGPARQCARRRAALRDAGRRRRLRDRDDVRLRRRATGRTSAARSPRGSSSASTRSRPGRPSCRGSSFGLRTGRSAGTP